jgi:hypothetical protein
MTNFRTSFLHLRLLDGNQDYLTTCPSYDLIIGTRFLVLIFWTPDHAAFYLPRALGMMSLLSDLTYSKTSYTISGF